jgi:hypothetical protein
MYKKWDLIKMDLIFHNFEFEKYNYGHFECFSDFAIHLVSTLKRFEIISHEPELAIPIFYDSVAGMNLKLLFYFRGLILYYLDGLDEIQRIVTLEYQGKSDIDAVREKSYFFAENEMIEFTIVCLNVALRNGVDSKIKYLEDLKKNYYYKYDTLLSKEIKDIEFVSRFNNKEITFCNLYIRLLSSYAKELESVEVGINDVQYYSFVDMTIEYDLYVTLLKGEWIPKRYKNRLGIFLRTGKWYKNKKMNRYNTIEDKIFFKGDQKTLAYCFYLLNDYGLLNKEEGVEKQFTPRELTKIIIDNFRSNDIINERSIYDYLRNGKINIPLNPIFIVKEFNNKDRPKVKFKLYKLKTRKKGNPINMSDVELIDYNDGSPFNY